jgi:hypothetical protein
MSDSTINPTRRDQVHVYDKSRPHTFVQFYPVNEVASGGLAV